MRIAKINTGTKAGNLQQVITSDKSNLFPGRQLSREDGGGREEEREGEEFGKKEEIVAKGTVEIGR